jgi:hypothetical protein
MVDLNTRIRESERIISEQNEYLTALRHLLAKETAGSIPAPIVAATPSHTFPEPSDIDFKGRTSEIILSLVQ